MDQKQMLGPVPLFLGVYTQNWSLAQFQQAAQDAKLLGCTSLLIKVADGLNYWYSGIGGWQAVLSSLNVILPAVPYAYCYGNAAGSSVSGESAMLAKIMQTAGIVIADMETEFNGQVSWAQQICSALKPVNGLFGVTSWADPVQQNWPGVLQALAPCVNFWMPQAYDDFLASLYQGQYSAYGVPVYPVLKLGSDVGPNNLLQNAQDAKSPIIALWEYQAIAAYAAMIKSIVAMLGSGNTMNVPTGWTYANGVLTAPAAPDGKQYQVVQGFATEILKGGWDPANVPVEDEHSVPGVPGTRQTFLYSALWWTPQDGVEPAPLGKWYLSTQQEISEVVATLGTLIATIDNAIK